MPPVDSVLVDFDGTACLHDVGADLLDEFGEPGWSVYDAAWERGELGGREVLDRSPVRAGGSQPEPAGRR